MTKSNRLDVVDKKCLRCGHHKLWNKPLFNECCKCGYEQHGGKK